MTKRLTINLEQYPFMGPDPIHIELNMQEIIHLQDRIQNLPPNEGLNWEEAHKALYFLVSACRNYFQRDFKSTLPYTDFGHNETNFYKNTLIGACLDSSTIIKYLGHHMGLNVKIYHTSCLKREQYSDIESHAFCIAQIPIKTDNHCKEQLFVIDPTYRQFFSDYQYEEGTEISKNKLEYKLKAVHDDSFSDDNTIGRSLTKTWTSLIMGDHLLKYGFLFLGHSLAKRYLNYFLLDEGDRCLQEETINDFFKNALTFDPLDKKKSIFYQENIITPKDFMEKHGRLPELCDIVKTKTENTQSKTKPQPTPNR